MSSRQFIFFVNPAARNGGAMARLKKVLEEMPAFNSRTTIVPIFSHEQVGPILDKLDGAVIPVAVGGDGTVNLLARALHETRHHMRPFGVLPFGTGNAFARAIGVSSVKRGLHILLRGKARSIDLLVTTHPGAPVATSSISTGFESILLGHYAQYRQHHTFMAAAVAFSRSSLGRYSGIRCVLDGHPFMDGSALMYNVGLYNMPCHAWGKVVFPAADPADGVALALACQNPKDYWHTLLRGLKKATNGTQYGEWKMARIETLLPVQVDGESVTPGAFDVSVRPGGIRVLMMEDFHYPLQGPNHP